MQTHAVAEVEGFAEACRSFLVRCWTSEGTKELFEIEDMQSGFRVRLTSFDAVAEWLRSLRAASNE